MTSTSHTTITSATPPLNGYFREGMLARALAAELSASELRAWLAELRTLSVPEAVAKIRGVLDPDDSGNMSGRVS